MSKMGLHNPFGYLKHKLWPKERPGVKVPLWFSTIKSYESPRLSVCRWHVIYHWKDLDKGYNFFLDIISIGGFQKKLWASKVIENPILGISRLQLGSPKTKWHLGVGPMARHKEYYKEEGGGFPQVQAMVSLMSSCLFVACLCTKNVPTMH
jgi:hypothetical protein